MIYPPVYEIAKASGAVLALLGSPEPRLTPFGKATQNTVRPYAVWQTIYGSPDNSLSCIPSEDNWGVQLDIYGTTPSSARAVAEALRDAYEQSFNQVVAWNGEEWEKDTALYRVSFTVEFWTERGS